MIRFREGSKSESLFWVGDVIDDCDVTEVCDVTDVVKVAAVEVGRLRRWLAYTGSTVEGSHSESVVRLVYTYDLTVRLGVRCVF